jgi:hypothetical protein
LLQGRDEVWLVALENDEDYGKFFDLYRIVIVKTLFLT